MDQSADYRSGKGHRDENVPVASRLVSARHRPVIMAFYDFARAADDIADHASLPAGRLSSIASRRHTGKLAVRLSQAPATARFSRHPSRQSHCAARNAIVLALMSAMTAEPMIATPRQPKTIQTRIMVRGSRRARGLQRRLKEDSFFNVVPLIIVNFAAA